MNNLYKIIFLFFCSVSAFVPAMCEAATISGKVYGGNTEMAYANLTLYDAISSVQVGNTVTSNSTGDYIFADVPDGNYKIYVMVPSGSLYRSTLIEDPVFAVSGADISRDILLTLPALSISGVVKSSSGIGITNIRVCTSPTYKCSITDANGTYTISGIDVGVYSLSASPYGPTNIPVPANGYSVQVSNILVENTDIVNDFIVPVATLSGKTTDATETTILPNVTISFAVKTWTIGNTTYSVKSQTIVSNSSGAYSVELLSYDNYSATLSPQSGSGFISTNVSGIDATTTNTKNLKLDPAYIISGTVKTTQGAGISNFKVCAYPLTTFTNGRCGISSNDGSYNILGVNLGVYRLFVSKNGTSNIPTPDGLSIAPIVPSIQVTANMLHQDLTIPVVVFTGRIYNRNNQPVVGATATVPTKTWNVNSVYTFIDSQIAKTDSSGRFTIALLSDSSYSFTLSPPPNTNYATWSINPFSILADIYQEKLLPKTVPEYKIDLTVTGTGNGTVTSNPVGMSCLSGNAGVCSWYFDQATLVTLLPSPDSISILTAWSGACSGSGVCGISMGADKTVGATIDLSPVAKILTNGYMTIQNAYNSANNGDQIKLLQTTIVGDVLLNRPINVLMTGGYTTSFSTPSGLTTTIDGTVTVNQGVLTVDGLVIK